MSPARRGRRGWVLILDHSPGAPRLVQCLRIRVKMPARP